jgi:hypothetical protein
VAARIGRAAEVTLEQKLHAVLEEAGYEVRVADEVMGRVTVTYRHPATGHVAFISVPSSRRSHRRRVLVGAQS